jgi:hypothetical protein
MTKRVVAYFAIQYLNTLSVWIVLDREWSLHLICKRSNLLLSVFKWLRDKVNLWCKRKRYERQIDILG